MRLFVSCLLFALVTALLIPISASAQTEAQCVAVYDSNGTRVGRANSGDTTDIHLSHQGRVVMLRVGRDGFQSNGHVWFIGANCAGEAFMSASGGAVTDPANVVGADVWYPDQSLPSATILPASGLEEQGNCIARDTTVADVVPAFNFTLPTYTPPIHFEAEPCAEPPDPEQFINGCISKNGTLKIVADPADCTSRETPITLLGP